ncbi:MAG: hypothetical protein C6H99_06265 [Epsilonproteobacteria bacterium]|nr:hypothetical protein [Campylobacterota bacterium]NPA63768.1 TlpA family protein disulfide reductase [Campylobacterota bacterium]
MIKKIILMVAFVALLFGGESIDRSFELTGVHGEKIHIHVKNSGIEVKEYPNKVIILDFFGKNCPPCKAEIPILGKLQKKMQDKLQIIGLHVQHPLTKRDIQELHERGINYPIFDYVQTEQNRAFVDFMGDLTGWSGTIPFMLFFDKSGNYAGYHLGMADEKSLEKFIEKLYNKQKKAQKGKNPHQNEPSAKESNTTKK